MEEINKKKITIITISVLMMIVVVIGVSYAYFSAGETSEIETVDAGTVTYTLTEGEILNANHLSPINDADATGSGSASLSFSAKNTGTLPSYVKIGLTDIQITDNLKNTYFKWALYDTDTNKKIETGDFEGVESEITLTKNILFEPEDVKNYTIYIWVSNNGKDQSAMMDGTFTGKIVIKANTDKEKDLLSKAILASNPVSTKTPSFNSTATTDEGLIQGTDADGPTYYFRGAVKDNYVKFEGLKWKNTDSGYHTAGTDMLWRIVRINGDGTIRLISDGSIGTSVYSSTGGTKYLGYTYDNSAANIQNGTPSTMKTYLENWYKSNMTNYDKYIATTRFCNDTTRSPSDSNYFRGYYRLYTNKSPSFICPKTTYTYGGEYNLKIGLLTADEAVFAGGKVHTSNINSSYYLAGTSNNFILGTPFETGSPYYLFSVYKNGSIWCYDITSSTYSVRPVINLVSDVEFSQGTGTKTDPYVIG